MIVGILIVIFIIIFTLAIFVPVIMYNPESPYHKCDICDFLPEHGKHKFTCKRCGKKFRMCDVHCIRTDKQEKEYCKDCLEIVKLQETVHGQEDKMEIIGGQIFNLNEKIRALEQKKSRK